MSGWSRTLACLAVASCCAAVLGVAPGADAKLADGTYAFELRIAFGDGVDFLPHPTLPVRNLTSEQRYSLDWQGGNLPSVIVGVPWRAHVVSATCSCGAVGFQDAQRGGHVHFNASRADAGVVRYTILATQEVEHEVIAFELAVQPVPLDPADSIVILHMPPGADVDGPTPPAVTARPDERTWTFGGAGEPVLRSSRAPTLWFTIHPPPVVDDGPATQTVTQTVTQAADASEPQTPGVQQAAPWLVAGLGLGALGWALLVARGWVQRPALVAAPPPGDGDVDDDASDGDDAPRPPGPGP